MLDVGSSPNSNHPENEVPPQKTDHLVWGGKFCASLCSNVEAVLHLAFLFAVITCLCSQFHCPFPVPLPFSFFSWTLLFRDLHVFRPQNKED